MRVLLDVRALADPALAERGIGRYVRSLLDALTSGGYDVVPLHDAPRPPAPARVAEALEHVLLARDTRRAAADVVHAPSIDRVSLRPGAPLAVTLHDLVPLKHPELYLRSGLKHRLRYAAVNRAQRVIVPSLAVARDAERLLRLGPQRIRVIAEAPAACFRPLEDPRSLLERLDLPERFILWVGGLDPPDPRKAVEGLAAAVAGGNGPPLVLAGRAGQGAHALASPGRVLLAGRVTDEELAALYGAADALVFPSEDEGFGLPPVEALACGTPVAAYAGGAVGETLAGEPAARLVEPGDLQALLRAAESLTGVRAEPPRRTWADVAAETWAVYVECAAL